MLTVILVTLLSINTNGAYLFSLPSIRSPHTHSPTSLSHFTLPDQLSTKANQYRVDRKALLNPGQKWKNLWSKRMEEKAGAGANLRRSEEISIEEKLVASVNVYQAMKSKEDQAMKGNEAIRAKERKNYFDHLAFMSRLTGK